MVEGERERVVGEVEEEGGGLGGSEVPDADPLKKNKRGEVAEKTFQTRS